MNFKIAKWPFTAKQTPAPQKRNAKMARPDNQSARKRFPLPFPKVDLNTRPGIDKFLTDLIKQTWQENPLDARTASALNSSVQMLLRARGWWDKPLEPEEKDSEPFAGWTHEQIVWEWINESGMSEKMRGDVREALQKMKKDGNSWLLEKKNARTDPDEVIAGFIQSFNTDLYDLKHEIVEFCEQQAKKENEELENK